jgi:large subunit ribosomal protein L21
VHEGSVFNVATLDAEPGARVELTDVLLVSDGDNIKVGSPTVDGAIVIAEVVEHGKGKKVVNFKYKAKVRYRRKRGHRQGYTQLEVREITVDGKTVTSTRRPRSAGAATPVEPSRPAGFAGREEEEAPAPRRRSRTASTEVTEETSTEASAETPAPRRRRAARSESSEETQE